METKSGNDLSTNDIIHNQAQVEDPHGKQQVEKANKHKFKLTKFRTVAS